MKIRSGVFETNSSSSHSLVIPQNNSAETVDLGVSKEELRRGLVIVTPDEYGWEWKRYYTVKNKLRYLVSQCIVTYSGMQGSYECEVDGGSDAETLTKILLERSPEFTLLSEVFRNRTGCELLVHPGKASVDHQSAWKYEQKHSTRKLFGDTSLLEEFIFNPNKCIQTGNDNEDLPWIIRTDKDPKEELCYKDAFKEKTKTTKTLEFSTKENSSILKTKDGKEISSNSAEFLQIKNGVLEEAKIIETGPYSLFKDCGVKTDLKSYIASTFSVVGSVEKWFFISPKLKVTHQFIRNDKEKCPLISFDFTLSYEE